MPSFCASASLGSCRRVKYFLVNFQRGSAKFVYAHMTRGFVASRFMGCFPRGGNPLTATPPGAIIVSAQAENFKGNSPRLLMRWITVIRAPDSPMRTSISFCSLVRGSTGSRAIRSAEHTSELQSRRDLVCRLLFQKKTLAMPRLQFRPVLVSCPPYAVDC